MRLPANADALPAAAARQILTGRMPQALLVAAIVTFALVLRWPGLQAGLHTDDYVQAAMLAGTFPAPRSALELYDFGGRTPADAARLRQHGWFPWWSAPDLELAMFRPLSSGLIAIDRALLGDAAGLRHAHSALWCGALLLAAFALFRALLPAATALLALLLLAADPSLTVPLAWLPNRTALVACALGVGGLHAYVRSRRGAGTRWALGAALAFALSVLAGEYALPLLGYVVVYEWLVAREPIRVRVRAAALALGPALLVVAAGTALGYATRGSGLYVSPLHDPLRYASAALSRVPALAAELLAGLALPAATGAGTPSDAALQLGAVALALGLLFAGARITALQFEPALHFFGVSSLLGLPLLAGALPEARLLVPLSLGAAAVIAALLRALLQRACDGAAHATRSRALAAALALVTCAVYLGVKPVRAFRGAQLLRARSAGHTAWALRAEVDDAHAGTQQWLVIAARDFTSAQILPFVRAFHGRALPRAYRLLSNATQAHELTRLDANTLELRVLGAAREPYAGALHRPRSLPFAAGDRAEAGDMRVHVVEVRGARPSRLRFAFPRPLDAPEYVFLHPGEAGLRRVVLPALGARLRLPPPRAPRLQL